MNSTTGIELQVATTTRITKKRFLGSMLVSLGLLLFSRIPFIGCSMTMTVKESTFLEAVNNIIKKSQEKNNLAKRGRVKEVTSCKRAKEAS
jgi:hypothetical protein